MQSVGTDANFIAFCHSFAICDLSRKAVPGELAVEGRRIDSEDLGGAWLIPALILQDPQDVGSLDGVQGGVGLHRVTYQRIRLGLDYTLSKR